MCPSPVRVVLRSIRGPISSQLHTPHIITRGSPILNRPLQTLSVHGFMWLSPYPYIFILIQHWNLWQIEEVLHVYSFKHSYHSSTVTFFQSLFSANVKDYMFYRISYIHGTPVKWSYAKSKSRRCYVPFLCSNNNATFKVTQFLIICYCSSRNRFNSFARQRLSYIGSAYSLVLRWLISYIRHLHKHVRTSFSVSSVYIH